MCCEISQAPGLHGAAPPIAHQVTRLIQPDVEDTPVTSGSSNTPPALAPPAAAVPPPARAPQRKWDGEDEDDDDVSAIARHPLAHGTIQRGQRSRQDDWDKSEDEKPKAKVAAPAPAKKKMTLKQKLAEKERLAQEKVSGLGLFVIASAMNLLRRLG
jgi:hypothetical protein